MFSERLSDKSIEREEEENEEIQKKTNISKEMANSPKKLKKSRRQSRAKQEKENQGSSNSNQRRKSAQKKRESVAKSSKKVVNIDKSSRKCDESEVIQLKDNSQCGSKAFHLNEESGHHESQNESSPNSTFLEKIKEESILEEETPIREYLGRRDYTQFSLDGVEMRRSYEDFLKEVSFRKQNSLEQDEKITEFLAKILFSEIRFEDSVEPRPKRVNSEQERIRIENDLPLQISIRPKQVMIRTVASLKAQNFQMVHFACTDRRIVFGRGKMSNIQLDNETICPSHCSLSMVNNRFYLSDLGSQKGTFIKMEGYSPTPLPKRCVLEIGPFILRLGFEDYCFESYPRILIEVQLKNDQIFPYPHSVVYRFRLKEKKDCERGTITIGSSDKSMIRMISPLVSKTHAVLFLENSQLFLVDQNSKNG